MMSDATTPNPLIEHDYFYLSYDGTYYIVGVEGAENPEEPSITFEINGHLDIPAEYNGKPVNEIGDLAFAYCDTLTSITIPDSVTSIGNSAFGSCTSLASITIPNSVTSIGNSAFSGCSDLTSVTIGNSVTSIGSSAFYNCDALTSITIPNSVTSIGGGAFEDCSALTSITIPSSVTLIDKYAFISCSNLTNVIIKGKPTVNTKAFNSTSKLEKIYVIEGRGYSPTDTIDGKPIEILPANGILIAKTMSVKLMKIS
jgi:hypothetical protein